ncbi:MAG: 2-succinyl-5-enolpyruvyl-6-hydroxy-3-cyclohexene-1-carboxylic-acid synthase [Chloroflexi bacterium]|nr:2-succinyl-5-enolpyruvyl-6-hydroxy-3-cyclohexene-1-carboxylic-acid synthase [Chloroflexota bacterium]
MQNSNTLYANVFVDALVAAGLKRVCVLPGSRHTPLILAFARHRDAIDIYSHLDERSAAFFALGLATATNEPAALVCTSGSAAANFFPAIIEARQSRTPLLVLSADRPPELRHSGANQTIDQVKLYGDAVAWFVDAPLPEAEPPPLALRNLRTLAARAMVKTAGGGVVHINLPFRKPFEPGDDDAEVMNIDRGETTRFVREKRSDASALDDLMRGEARVKRGLIYFGHGSCRTAAEAGALIRWAARASRISGYPILAEYTSNMRNIGLSADKCYEPLGAYETYLGAAGCEFKSIEALIRFGTPPLSKAMGDLVAQADLKHHIYCSRDGEWADDSHGITELVHFDPLSAAPMPCADDPPTTETAFRDRIRRAEEIAWKLIDREMETGDYFDGAVVYDVADLMPADGLIFAGNSLPVRQLDQFGKPSERPILAFANRGASGIDGNISSALGIGAAYRDRPLAAIVGDITFYHDMNGLLAIRRCGVPVTIVVLNNAGGGIFHRLPIHRFEPAFSDYFITAHGLGFSHAAQLYGLDYRRADDRLAFRRAFSEAVAGRGSTLIEVRTDALNDLRRREQIMATIRAEVEEMNACD